MKKFSIFLLLLGLIVSFSITAFAQQDEKKVNVKFSGEYYGRWSYMDNPKLTDPEGGSFSYFDQRFRILTTYSPVEGLSLTTRMDLLENIWGASGYSHAVAVDPATGEGFAEADPNPDTNIAIDRAYLTAKTAIGTFVMGYQGFETFGTSMFDNSTSQPGIKYTLPLGPASIFAYFQRRTQGDVDPEDSNKPDLKAQNVNRDIYNLGGTFKAGAIQAGFQVENQKDNTAKTSDGYKRDLYYINPFAKAKLGVIEIEAEGYYVTGDVEKYSDSAIGTDIKAKAYGAYANAKVNLGVIYVGGLIVYMTGDDPTTDDMEGGGRTGSGSEYGVISTLGLGRDKEVWGNYSSILFNEDYHDYLSSKNSTPKTWDNVTFLQVYAGVKPTDKLEIMARLALARANEVASGQKKDMGIEVDTKGSLTLFDGTTFNLGFAYLKTGDYFKGTGGGKVTNEYYASSWIMCEW